MSLKAMMVALTFAASVPVVSQVLPSATEGHLPIKVGGGVSYFNSSFGDNRLLGGAVWVDGTPPKIPHSLHGLGLEAEVRYITVGQPASDAGGIFHQGTVGGGPTYTWFHFHNFHPYAKLLVDVGRQDFNVGTPNFHHETQLVYAPGGGVDYRVFKNLWARADYEYQIWPDPFGDPNWTLDPQGFTLGMSWDFRRYHRQ